MKKSLAILLALALVFSSFTVAFANTEIGADAKACQSLGMLKGATAAGVTADYLKTAPTRIQAAILFLRLKGLEQQALAFTGTDNFADANKAAWAKPVMAYLKANPELGWNGVGNNLFQPEKEILAKDYYKVMLTALGYKQNTAEVIGDFTNANVVEFAAKQGLTKVAGVLSFTVNDVAIATMEALKAKVKGTEKTLAFSLVEAKVITQAAAVEAGVYTVPAVALAVESVSATNLRQITVKFNKEVDKDTIKVANFKVDGADASAVALGDDKKTVTVTVATPATTQPANYKLTVANVKDAAGKAIAKYETTLRVLDTAIPVVNKMELTGPKTFEITFSEPIKTAGEVKVNNGVYGVARIDMNPSRTKATVELAASSLNDGSYTVEIKGFKDYAEFSIDTTTLTLVYAKNVTKPVAKIKSATQTEVVVEFDRVVVLDDQFGAGADKYEDYFYHTFSNWRPNSVATTDGKTYTLTFTTFPIPEGTSTLVVKAKGFEGKAIEDLWGNKLEENTNLAVTVTADKTAPTVKEVKVASEDVVYIYFSEEMDKAKAENTSNFKFKDKDGKDVTTPFANSYVYTPATSESKLTITFTAKLSGNYTVDIKGLEDKALTANPLAAVTLAFTVTDLTAPSTTVTITGIEKSLASENDVIFVEYDEKMAVTGDNSVLKASNYLLDGKDLPEKATIEAFGTTGKVVKITIPDATKTILGKTLTIGRVADLAGNKVSVLSFGDVIKPATAPTVTMVKVTDFNKATVVVSDPLSVVLASGFRTATNDVAAIDSWSINDKNETEINITVNGADKALEADTSSVFSKFFVREDILVAETGIKMASAEVATVNIKDYRAPKLIAETSTVKAVVDSSTANAFEMIFTEDLDARNITGTTTPRATLFAHDLVITDKDGKVKVAGVDYTTSIVGGNKILVQFTSTITAGTKFTVKTKETVNYIRDNSAQYNKATVITTAKEVTIN